MARIVKHSDGTRFGQRKSALIFYHIPKTAGLTVNDILEKNFSEIFWFYDGYPWGKALEEINSRNHHIAITGHNAWGMHENISDEFVAFYMTIIRHPWDLCKSMFAYSLMLYEQGENFEDYVDRHYPSNFLVKNLGNNSLDLAKQRLANDYYSFGIVQHFQASLALLADHFNLTNLNYELKNKSNSNQVQFDQRCQDNFYEKNRHDIELFKWAMELFSARAAQKSIELSHETPQTFHGQSENKEDDRRGADRSDPNPPNGFGRAIEVMTQRRKLEPFHARKKFIPDALINLYTRMGDDTQLEKFLCDNRVFFFEYTLMLAKLYQTSAPHKAIKLLLDELDSLSTYHNSIPDSALNRYKVRCLRILAQTFESTANLDRAEACYETAYQLNPNNFNTLRLYCRLLSRNREHRKIIPILSKIRCNDHPNGNLLRQQLAEAQVAVKEDRNANI